MTRPLANPKWHWLPFSTAAALLIGALLAVALLPMSDMQRAMQAVASPEAQQRQIAWTWLAEHAPGAHQARVTVLLRNDPATLGDALDAAGDAARRDGAVALLGIDGVDLDHLPPKAHAGLITALQRGSLDEQRLADYLGGGSLQSAPDDVNMQP